MIARLAMTFVILLTAGLCAADEPQSAEQAALAELQGEWEIVSFHFDTGPAARSGKVVIKEDVWKRGMPLKISLDVAKQPKQLDIGPWRGIYKLEGDTLTFCRSNGAGGTRPTKFKAVPGAVLIVLKRAEEQVPPEESPR